MSSNPKRKAPPSPPSRLAQASYDALPTECPVESPLGNVYANTQIQRDRLRDLNQLMAELLDFLGVEQGGSDSQKLSEAPYGRLDEIRHVQSQTYDEINELERRIYSVRSSLM